MISLVLLSIALFAATNVDDLFLLLSLFGECAPAKASVVVGQLLGVTLIVLVSLACSMIAIIFLHTYIRLLGVVPLAIGINKLLPILKLQTPDVRKANLSTKLPRHILGVATLTFASGGDNIGVYTPLLSTRPFQEIITIVITFFGMTAAWCMVACWLAGHKTLGYPVRKYSLWLLPIVLITLGLRTLFPD